MTLRFISQQFPRLDWFCIIIFNLKVLKPKSLYSKFDSEQNSFKTIQSLSNILRFNSMFYKVNVTESRYIFSPYNCKFFLNNLWALLSDVMKDFNILFYFQFSDLKVKNLFNFYWKQKIENRIDLKTFLINVLQFEKKTFFTGLILTNLSNKLQKNKQAYKI